MINIIKMELFRLTRQKSAYIMLIIAVAFTLFSMLMVNEDLRLMKEDVNSSISIDSVDMEGSTGIFLNTDEKWIEDGYEVSIWELLMTHCTSRIYLLFAGIAMILFVSAESKHGFVKTIAGQLTSRSGLVVSKLLPIAFYIIVLFIINIVAIAIISKYLFGYASFARLGSYIVPISIQFLLHFAFCAMIISIAMLTQSASFSMVVVSMMSIGISQMVFSMIFTLLNHWGVVSDNFDYNKYLITGNTQKINVTSANSEIIRAAIVAVIFTVTFTALAMTVYKKRDVK